MRNLRKPLVPLFKVYDLRRNLSDYIEKLDTQSALCFARISVNRQSGHPVKFNGTFPYSLKLIVFACALSFLFFKLSHSFFAVEKVHDRRDKCASQRIHLVLRYSRVVFFFSPLPFFPVYTGDVGKTIALEEKSRRCRFMRTDESRGAAARILMFRK